LPGWIRIQCGAECYSRDVFTGLFYSSRYRNDAVLTKKGRSIALPNAANLLLWQ